MKGATCAELTLQSTGWRTKLQWAEPGAVFLFTVAGENTLGHFVAGDRTALATILAIQNSLQGYRSQERHDY